LNNKAGATISGRLGIENFQGTIDTLTNNGTIQGIGSYAVQNNGGTITSFYNYGSLNSTVNTYLLDNLGGTIGLLVNAQGTGNGSNKTLLMRGNAPATYKTYIASPTDYGQLEVGFGTWDFNNITYGIADNSTVAAMTYQDVIQAGALATFNNTTDKTGTYFDGSSTWDWTLTWDSANWDLIVSSQTPSTPLSNAVGALGNTAAAPAATVIDANANILALFTGTQQQLADAVTQTLPLLTGGAPIAVGNSLAGMNRVIQARLYSGMSSGDDFVSEDRHVWLKPFGSWVDQDDRNGVSGFDANTWGIVSGVDTVARNNWRLGVAFGYANTTVDSNSTIAPQSSDIDIYQLIGYGSKSIAENTEFNFQIDFGKNKNAGNRTIAFTSTVASSDFDSNTFHAGVGTSHQILINDENSFVASVRGDYTRIINDAYTETGAGLLNLNVDEQSTEAMVFSVEGKLMHKIDEYSDVTAKLGVGYDAINEQASITAAFAGAPTAAFTTNGIDPEPWTAHAGLSYIRQVNDVTSLRANYTAESREDFLNHTASVNVRWAF
jgi:outer membrane autotransporter protein